MPIAVFNTLCVRRNPRQQDSENGVISGSRKKVQLRWGGACPSPPEEVTLTTASRHRRATAARRHDLAVSRKELSNARTYYVYRHVFVDQRNRRRSRGAASRCIS